MGKRVSQDLWPLCAFSPVIWKVWSPSVQMSTGQHNVLVTLLPISTSNNAGSWRCHEIFNLSSLAKTYLMTQSSQKASLLNTHSPNRCKFRILIPFTKRFKVILSRRVEWWEGDVTCMRERREKDTKYLSESMSKCGCGLLPSVWRQEPVAGLVNTVINNVSIKGKK